MDKRLNVYDIVQWQEPGGVRDLWMVSLWAKGHAGITLNPSTVDFRSDACKSNDLLGSAQWAVLIRVGSPGTVAVDIERIHAEGLILNSSVDQYDEDPEDYEEIDHFDEDD